MLAQMFAPVSDFYPGTLSDCMMRSAGFRHTMPSSLAAVRHVLWFGRVSFAFAVRRSHRARVRADPVTAGTRLYSLVRRRQSARQERYNGSSYHAGRRRYHTNATVAKALLLLRPKSTARVELELSSRDLSANW